MRKTKTTNGNLGIRSDLNSKSTPTRRKSIKTTPSTMTSQNTSENNPEHSKDIFSKTEKESISWRDYRRPYGPKKSLDEGETSQRSNISNESDNIILREELLNKLPRTKGHHSKAKSQDGLDGMKGSRKVKKSVSVLETGTSPVDNDTINVNGIVNDPILLGVNAYTVSSAKNAVEIQSKKDAEKNVANDEINPVSSASKKKTLGLWNLIKPKEVVNREPVELPLSKSAVEPGKRGLHNTINVQDLNDFLQDELIVQEDSPKHKSAGNLESPDSGPCTAEDLRYMGNDNDLIQNNNRNVPEQYNGENEESSVSGTHHKKYLSIIFSTGRSMDVSIDSKDNIDMAKGLREASIIVDHEIQADKHRSNGFIRESLYNIDESPKNIEKRRWSFCREYQNGSDAKENCTTKPSTAETSEEDMVMNVIQGIRLQNKENIALDEALTKLTDFYYKHMERYEERIKMVTEKCEKYREGNKTLVQVIRNWEKEMDQLATTNKSLHDLMLGLEDELEQEKSQAAQLTEASLFYKKELNLMKEQVKHHLFEVEEVRKHVISRDNKIISLNACIRNCGDFIQTLNTNFKTMMKEKLTTKISIDALSKSFETIENKTSKFLDELEVITHTNTQNTPTGFYSEPTNREKTSSTTTEESTDLSAKGSNPLIIPPSLKIDLSPRKSFQIAKKPEALTSKTEPSANTSNNYRSLLKSPPKQAPNGFNFQQISAKKMTSPKSKPVSAVAITTTPKTKYPNLPSYFVKKCLTQRLSISGEKKQSISVSAYKIDDRGRSTERGEGEKPVVVDNKSRDKSAPEIKPKGGAKDKKLITQ